MAECTPMELRNARESAKMARWQAAAQAGVSEDTIRRWEEGTTRPEPDDVWRLEMVYHAPGLWHRWMRSTYDSYRTMWPEVVDRTLPMAVVNVRHQLADVLRVQDAAERDAMDGTMDDPCVKASYRRELVEAQAAIAEALARLDGKEDAS